MGDKPRSGVMPLSPSAESTAIVALRAAHLPAARGAQANLWDVAVCDVAIGGLLALGAAISGTWAERLIPVLALPGLLFCPGYLLTVALFAGPGQLTWVERSGLALALSIGAIVFAGLALYFLALPINRLDLSVALGTVSVALSVAGGLRRMRFPPAPRYASHRAARSVLAARSEVVWALGIAVLAALALTGVWYGLMIAASGEHYTEFSLLNPATGKADPGLRSRADVPYELTVSITNHEQVARRYAVGVADDRGYAAQIPVGTLADGASWSRLVRVPVDPHAPLRHLVIELFVAGRTGPYRELHVWLTQAERP